ncbi:P3IP1 protein, partial [Stercorarius parasiticus]|nr:P3IP1 protein [Stercorarius parasiticus]
PSAPRMLRGGPRRSAALGALLLGWLLLAAAEECLRGNGASYRGSRRVASGGAPCLNWLAFSDTSLDLSHSQGTCCFEALINALYFVCLFFLSADATAATASVPTAEVGTSQEVDQVFEPADTLPSRSEAAAVQPIIGISQRVQVNSKEKKDLGTLGYVLGLIMMVIIIAIGAGIVLGYIYKRGKDLKEKHEQKVYEREMQRITLPLSAFTNPACELVDENTIVVHTNQTPVEDTRDGSGPLMGQAGTPGA